MESYNTVDLYKLPKDILVKLISTIRDDMRQEYNEQIRNIFTKVCSGGRNRMATCSFKDCNKCMIQDYTGEILYITDGYIYHCNECYNAYCCDHLNEGKIDGKVFCSKCFNNVLDRFEHTEGLIIVEPKSE